MDRVSDRHEGDLSGRLEPFAASHPAVVAVSIPREVAGDAAVYVNPYDVADITRGLRRLAEMPSAERAQLKARERARAATFTWQRFHDGLAAVLRQAASVQ